MQRSDRVARVYLSAVMFAETFVIISFRGSGLPLWAWFTLFVGPAALLLPLVGSHPTRFLRVCTSVLAIILSLTWAWASWPVGTVGWLAISGLIWFATLPGQDGHTPQDHERRSSL